MKEALCKTCNIDNQIVLLYTLNGSLYYVFLNFIKIYRLCMCKLLLLLYTGREGTFGYLFYWSPKLYNNVFLFVGFTTLGILKKF